MRLSRVLLLCALLVYGCGGGGSSAPQAASGVTVQALAGTWSYAGSGTELVSGGVLCGVSFTGTIVLNSSGTGTLAQSNHSSNCSVTASTNDTITATSVNANGTGTISLASGEVDTIQVSIDLNTIVWADLSTSGFAVTGSALRL